MSLRDEAWKVLRPLGSQRTASAPFYLDEESLPFAIMGYSQAGEDLLVRRLFKREISAGYRGTYVDLGCALPISIANTYLFYCLGWRGLCVDANTAFADEWKQRRPEDIFINTGLGRQEGIGYLFKSTINVGMSEVTLRPDSPGADFLPYPDPVPIQRLDALFAQYLGDRKIDFLSIDLEGAELDVLQSNDWQRWRPQAILIECVTPGFTDVCDQPKIQYLAQWDYHIHSKVFGNVLLVQPHLV